MRLLIKIICDLYDLFEELSYGKRLITSMIILGILEYIRIVIYPIIPLYVLVFLITFAYTRIIYVYEN